MKKHGKPGLSLDLKGICELLLTIYADFSLVCACICRYLYACIKHVSYLAIHWSLSFVYSDNIPMSIVLYARKAGKEAYFNKFSF